MGLAVAYLGLLALLFLDFDAAEARTPQHEPVVVTITDEGVDPQSVEVGRGGLLVWRNESTLPRQVVDEGFGLFDSGELSPGEEFSYSPTFAGGFSYIVDMSPSLGLEEFQVDAELDVGVSFEQVVHTPSLGWKVRWAPPQPPSEREDESPGFGGLAFDVQRGTFRYGSPTEPYVGKWRRWHRGTPLTSDVLPIDCDGKSYRVRVRIRDINSGVESRWSPDNGVACIED